jgi:hypothetical protein
MTYFPATNPSTWAPRPLTNEEANRLLTLVTLISEDQVDFIGDFQVTGEVLVSVKLALRDGGVGALDRVFRVAVHTLREHYGDKLGARQLQALVAEVRLGERSLAEHLI